MADDKHIPSVAQPEQEPVAFVPVHPRNGPLWSDTYAATSFSERSPNYPRMALYAAQPPAAPVETAQCAECGGSGLTDNHVTGEVCCSSCDGSGHEDETLSVLDVGDDLHQVLGEALQRSSAGNVVAYLHECPKYKHKPTLSFEPATNPDWTSEPLYRHPPQTAPDTVPVPKAALEWLFGEGPAPDGRTFGDDEDAEIRTPRKYSRKYWWRSRFRNLIPSLSLPRPQDK